MKTANKILSTALSLGLILSPIASAGAQDASKEMVSPQKAQVGTGTTAGQTDGGTLTAGYIITGIAAAALLAVVLEVATGGKKDRGTTPPPPPPGPGEPPETTPPATPPPTTPPSTTPATTTGTGTGN